MPASVARRLPRKSGWMAELPLFIFYVRMPATNAMGGLCLYPRRWTRCSRIPFRAMQCIAREERHVPERAMGKVQGRMMYAGGTGMIPGYPISSCTARQPCARKG